SGDLPTPPRGTLEGVRSYQRHDSCRVGALVLCAPLRVMDAHGEGLAHRPGGVMRSRRLYVISRAPQVGACKTRLSPPLLPTEAADLARAFLLDTITVVRQARLDPWVICRDAVERAALVQLLG